MLIRLITLGFLFSIYTSTFSQPFPSENSGFPDVNFGGQMGGMMEGMPRSKGAVVELQVDKLCPFNPSSKDDISSILANIKIQLEKFKKECPQLASIADSASSSSSFQNVSSQSPLHVIMINRDSTNGPSMTYTTSQAPAVTTNGLQMDCSNYVSLLQIEMESALHNPQSTQRYFECVSDLNIQSCVVRVYSREKSAIDSVCKGTAKMRFQADFLKNLQATSQSVSDAIANSSICNNGSSQIAKDSMYQTGSSLLNSISNIGIAFGLPGIALSVGANIAEGLVRNSAVNGTADDYLHKLSEEKEFPVMACLWLKIQDKVLKCENNIKVDPSVNYQPTLCKSYLMETPEQTLNTTSIRQLISFFTDKKDEIKSVVKSNNEEENNDREDNLITQFNQNLGKLIADPVVGRSQPIKVKDHLEVMLKFLSSEKSDQLVKSKVVALNALLKVNDEIISSNDEANSRALKKEFVKKFNAIDLSKIIDAYWKGKNAGIPYEKFEADLLVSEELAILDQLSLNSLNENSAHGSSLITPMNATISVFKNKFEKRLERAASRYENAVKSIKDDPSVVLPKIPLNELKIAAEELTQICSLLSGIYNSPNTLSNDVNPLANITGQTNSTYRNSCKHVNCLQIMPEKKNSIVLADQIQSSEDYRKYQCEIKKNYRQILKDFDSKLLKISKQKPEICDSLKDQKSWVQSD